MKLPLKLQLQHANFSAEVKDYGTLREINRYLIAAYPEFQFLVQINFLSIIHDQEQYLNRSQRASLSSMVRAECPTIIEAYGTNHVLLRDVLGSKNLSLHLQTAITAGWYLNAFMGGSGYLNYERITFLPEARYEILDEDLMLCNIPLISGGWMGSHPFLNGCGGA